MLCWDYLLCVQMANAICTLLFIAVQFFQCEISPDDPVWSEPNWYFLLDVLEVIMSRLSEQRAVLNAELSDLIRQYVLDVVVCYCYICRVVRWQDWLMDRPGKASLYGEGWLECLGWVPCLWGLFWRVSDAFQVGARNKDSSGNRNQQAKGGSR